MSADPSQDRTSGPLGPAVSPRSAAPHSGFASPSEPLAPFHARPAAPRANAAPVAEVEIETEPAEALELVEPQAEPVPEPTPAAAPGFDELPWLYLAEEERVVEPEAPAAEPYAAQEEAPAADTALIEPVAGLEPERSEPAAREPGRSDALSRVAERLEAIARSLRERDPADLSLDPADPLQLLITGYALGYAEASEGGEAERR